MKNLIEISKIVTRKKVRKIEIFDSSTFDSKSSKFVEFYEALTSGKFKNDRDAATFLYGCSPTDDKYRQLKSRFRKRLLNTLFFIDINEPSASGYDRAYFSCNKDWTLVKILIANEAHHSAEDLANQILTTALKFRFADVIVNCCRILRQYAAEGGRTKEFEEYDRLIKQYSDILSAEIRSEEMLQRIMMNYLSPKTEIPNLTQQLDIYCDALVGLSETYESPIVLYNMYLVWAFRYEILHDYEAMIQVCNQAENFITENPNYVQDDKVMTFLLKKISACLHLRDFKTGRTVAEKGLRLFPEDHDQWFLFMEYYILLAIHTGNYINALAILHQVRENNRYKKLDSENREKWNLFEIYLAYLTGNAVEESQDFKTSAKKPFRVSRFLNNNALYPKEQKVIAIHIIIAQVLFLMDMKNFNAAAERIEILKSYANKQLDRVENFRMIQFIRLLQLLAKADFQIHDLSNTDKYYDRLVENPFFYRGMINELEILPFESLWNHILAKFSN